MASRTDGAGGQALIIGQTSAVRLALRAVLLASGVVAALTQNARAWGLEGHHIAAEIAERYLEPEAARQVHELLAIENATTLAEVSTWADDIRGQRRDTAPWHYVNIPIHPQYGPPAYDAERDCPRGNCVVSKIDEFTAELRDRAVPRRERLEALKFLVHFVADIHQPLHCADDHDRGGNDVHISFLGHTTTLHALWDSGLLEAAQITDERSYAAKLAQLITPANLEKWRRGSPSDWATESYGIARSIYGESQEARSLQVFYEAELLPVVNTQLEKAGVRLAGVLNQALK